MTTPEITAPARSGQLRRDGACLHEGVARRHGCRPNWARTTPRTTPTNRPNHQPQRWVEKVDRSIANSETPRCDGATRPLARRFPPRSVYRSASLMPNSAESRCLTQGASLAETAQFLWMQVSRSSAICCPIPSTERAGAASAAANLSISGRRARAIACHRRFVLPRLVQPRSLAQEPEQSRSVESKQQYRDRRASCRGPSGGWSTGVCFDGLPTIESRLRTTRALTSGRWHSRAFCGPAAIRRGLRASGRGAQLMRRTAGRSGRCSLR
jgi:hypothetical protein